MEYLFNIIIPSVIAGLSAGAVTVITIRTDVQWLKQSLWNLPCVRDSHCTIKEIQNG